MPPQPRRVDGPFLFLDIDGVLLLWDESALNPDRIELLNQLIERTNAHVVVSSSWRETMSLRAIEDQLTAAGFTGTLHSATPVLVGASRGEEIASWLEQHARAGASIAILDDSSDVKPFRARLVLTDEYVGLTRELTEHAAGQLMDDIP